MSHYTTLETQLVSEMHLVLALEDMCATDLLAEQDFSLVEEEVDKRGAVHLTLRRMA